jgi:hypothetical protein
MKSLISTIDPPVGAVEPLDADCVAGADGADPPLSDSGPQPVARTNAASNATKQNRRRGRREESHGVFVRFMIASVSGDAGRGRLANGFTK